MAGLIVPAMEDTRQTKWDLRWLSLAKLVSTFSKDPSTKCGAVIIRPDNSVAAVGYNGFPRGMSDDPKLYTNRDEKYPRVIHCEINAVLSMKNESAHGYTLYTYPFLTCDRCAVHMVQAGIIREVAPIIPPDQASRWQASIDRALEYYRECGVKVRTYDLNRIP